MQLRQRRCGQQNIIVCFSECLSSLFMQINRTDVEGFLRAKYPQATNLVYLPDSFSSVVKYLKHNCTGSSYYRFSINKHLTSYCTERVEAHIRDLFSTERSVEDWCISIIIEEYSKVTSEMLPLRARKKYLNNVKFAKARWLKRRESRLQLENYLGINDFDTELKRSCGEFYNELKKGIHCSPIRWYSMN